MKRIITILLFDIVAINISCAQEILCNRTVYLKAFEKRLPKEICLPEGYMIRDILADTIDIDGNDCIDFAVKLEKINVVDGDTNLMVIYKKDKQGLFKEWKTFKNLYPLYLHNYSYDYYRDHRDTSYFMSLRRRYTYPLSTDVLFEKGTIISKFNTEGGGGLLLYFIYDKTIDSWKLTKQLTWGGRFGKINKIDDYQITPQIQYDIREFNLLDYLDE